MRRFIVLLMLLWGAQPLPAQTDPNLPLAGPLIALDTPRQDRIILYDLGARQPSGRQRALSFGTQWHHVWDFSPDGCRILFTLSDGTAPARLYSARLDGSDMQALVQYDALPEASWGVWEPDWSPTGAQIAFTMIRDQPQRGGSIERQYHVAWVTPDGGEPVFYSVTGREHSPQWSPDGQWLAYVSYDQRVPGADIFSTAVPTPEPPPGQPTVEPVLLDEADLWVVSADSQVKYRLTSFPTGSVRDPRWSPDGELLSFIYSPTAFNDTFWMIANQDGAIPTQLNNEWVLVLDNTWLPDSTAILASARALRGIAENRLWTIPLVGNADENATLYPNDSMSLALNHADFPRFSPDGQWLALRSAYDLVFINLENQIWDIPDPSLRGNTAPIWSPAGFTGETGC